MANLPGKPVLLRALLIVAGGFWVYWPALQGGWIWDDELLITQNGLIHDPAGLWKIWFEPGSLIDYQPLKVSVEWLEWRLWGNETLGYHLLSVSLHIVSALLVWRLLSKLGLRLAWMGGLLFAVHPVMVESVAWIAELKNTLSLPPFLLAMSAYLDYDERKKSKDYFLALGLFLVAMLCKTTMVMFPVAILLHAWWKRGRIGWSDLKTSSPFFALALVMGLITVGFLHHAMGNQQAIPLGGFLSRVALAGLSLSFYFCTCVWPVGLLPVYPQWPVDPPSLLQFLPWPVLGGVIIWFWTKRTSWGRHLLFGLGFFLINLLPFIGFTAGSYMTFTWVMDHFLYIPIMGLIGLAAAGLARLEEEMPKVLRPYGRGGVALMLALLAWESHGYAAQFANQETFWTYTLQRNPQAWIAHDNLGHLFLETGRVPEALEHLEAATQINPNDAGVLNNLGNALVAAGRGTEAMEPYEHALRINPQSAQARNGLGNAYQQAGRFSEAMDFYEQALRLKPDYAEAHYDLGSALQQTGRLEEAMEQYGQALRINPNLAEAHLNLGNALLQSGHASDALDQYEQTLRINPNNTGVHDNMAVALAKMGRLPEAIEQFESVLQINPNDAFALKNLARIQALQKTTQVKK